VKETVCNDQGIEPNRNRSGNPLCQTPANWIAFFRIKNCNWNRTVSK